MISLAESLYARGNSPKNAAICNGRKYVINIQLFTAPNDFDTYIRRVTIIQRDEAISGLSTQFDALLVIGQLYDFQNCLVGGRLFWKVIAATISRCQVRQEFQFGDFCLHRRCLCGINKYSVRNIQKQINQLNNEKLES